MKRAPGQDGCLPEPRSVSVSWLLILEERLDSRYGTLWSVGTVAGTYRESSTALRAALSLATNHTPDRQQPARGRQVYRLPGDGYLVEAAGARSPFQFRVTVVRQYD